MDASPRQTAPTATSDDRTARTDIASRSGNIVTAAITIGVLTLTIVAAWTTVGPAA